MTTWIGLLYSVSFAAGVGVLGVALLIVLVRLLWLFDRPSPVLDRGRKEGSQSPIQPPRVTYAGRPIQHAESSERSTRQGLVEVKPAVLTLAPELARVQSVDVAQESYRPFEPAHARPALRLPPRAPRPTAEHFERHRGVPGWLYAARNEFHRDGLYKLGYATIAVEARMEKMNDEFAESAHAGEFKALFSVPVQSSRDSELQLFALLDDYRVSKGCEFFVLPLGFIAQAMNVVASRSGDALDRTSDLLEPRPAVPPELAAIRRGAPSVAAAPLLADGSGMVVVLRNEAYRPDIYRLGHTKSDLFQYKARLDSEQRRHTSQIGFFSVVAAWPSMSQRAVFEGVLAELASCRLGRTSFVSMPLEQLKVAIEGVAARIAASTCGGAYPLLVPAKDRLPRAVAVDRSIGPPVSRVDAASAAQTRLPSRTLPSPETRPHPAPGEPWMKNTCPYPTCFQTVRAAGPLGTTGWLRCASCRRLIEYEIADESLLVSREHL